MLTIYYILIEELFGQLCPEDSYFSCFLMNRVLHILPAMSMATMVTNHQYITLRQLLLKIPNIYWICKSLAQCRTGAYTWIGISIVLLPFWHWRSKMLFCKLFVLIWGERAIQQIARTKTILTEYISNLRQRHAWRNHNKKFCSRIVIVWRNTTSLLFFYNNDPSGSNKWCSGDT